MPERVRHAESFTWQQVANLCRDLRPGDGVGAIPAFLVDEFSSFLKEEGLSDAPALSAAHAFTFAARSEADRTMATLLELAAGHVRRAWGEPKDFRKTGSSPNYGPGWWAGYAPVRGSRRPIPKWGST